VVINSPETVAAVEFMTKLFKQSMTDEVFSWNPASNNQGLIAGNWIIPKYATGTDAAKEFLL
jgi:hypothetical protein